MVVGRCWRREGCGDDEEKRRLSLVGGCERSSHDDAGSLVAGGRPWWGWKILGAEGLSVLAEPSLWPSTIDNKNSTSFKARKTNTVPPNFDAGERQDPTVALCCYGCSGAAGEGAGADC